MAEAKDEAGGRALEYDGHIATVDNIVTELLANPEARMAVLEKMPEYANLRESSAALMVDFDRNCDQLEQALAKLKTLAESRLPHLEEAAELLRLDAPHINWWRISDWLRRDRALSVPTADSGKGQHPPYYEDCLCPDCRAERRRRIGDEAAEEANERIREKAPGIAQRCAKCGAVDGQCALRGCLTDSERAAPVAEAPTAESGKDSSATDRIASALAYEHNRQRGAFLEPAPVAEALASQSGYLSPQATGLGGQQHQAVAEAPERVTHTQAGVALQAISERTASKKTQERLELLELYRQQQEQSEREVASLRTQLTDANLKAEGLRVDNEEMRRELERRIADAMDTDAKLAESERKLGEAERVRVDLLACAKEMAVFVQSLVEANRAHPHTSTLATMTRLLCWNTASTEPAGVEAVWTQEELDAVEREATELHEKLGIPTPTEPEAPARFRVGQRVKRAANITNGDGTVTRLVRNERGFNNWVKWDNGGECNYQDRELEPADPAPPKPGAAPAPYWPTNPATELMNHARNHQDFTSLLGLVEMLCQYVEADQNQRLEREGGGES